MQEPNELTFLFQFSKLHTKLVKNLDCLLSYHGVSFTEYMIMHNLHEAPKRTMSRIQLAESVGITASGVTRLLAPMEKNRITERESNPRDARMSLVKLSKAGERLYRESTVSFNDGAKSITNKFNDVQLQQMIKLLNVIC